VSGAYGGGKRLQNRTWVDDDGAQLFVQQGLTSGAIIFDTDPDSPGIDSMVSLTKVQVAELIKFLQSR